MEYNNKSNTPNIIAFILIASLFMETVVTAPVLGDISPSQKSRSTKNPRKLKAVNQQINKGFKNNERQKNPFDNEAVKAWKNPCNSIGYITPIYNAQDIDKQSYNVSYQNIKVSVHGLKASLPLMDKINTTDIQSWEQFNNATYSYLPTRPTGIVQKWHEHTQIYVASFSLLYKFQLREDFKNNNNTISQELKDILDRARELLCDIEHFVNATSNKNGQNKPYWFEKDEMAQIVTLHKKKNKHILNNLFVKARFEHYIERLYKRIQNFNLEKNLEKKSISNKIRPFTTLRPRKNRTNRKGRHRTTLIDKSTEKTFIITTRKPRKNLIYQANNSKVSLQKKSKRLNQSLF